MVAAQRALTRATKTLAALPRIKQQRQRILQQPQKLVRETPFFVQENPHRFVFREISSHVIALPAVACVKGKTNLPCSSYQRFRMFLD